MYVLVYKLYYPKNNLNQKLKKYHKQFKKSRKINDNHMILLNFRKEINKTRKL